jgi:hypothetical protein
MCEYPTGYVEPYPETFARIRLFAEEAAQRIDAADYTAAGSNFREIKKRQVEFLKQMAQTLGQLEGLARKELAAERFTEEETQWIKKVIDARGGGSGPPRYSGWYCNLFYGRGQPCAEWDPTVVDVHTDPTTQTVLEEGVGNCTFLVAAIDNEDDRMIYVGPAYAYYEFSQPAASRLTDLEWQQMLMKGEAPPRPEWTKAFQGPKLKRPMITPRGRTRVGGRE